MPTKTKPKKKQDITTLYNVLMGVIEPELTTDMLPDLDFLYAGETAELRSLRMTWYAIAFELFYARYEELMQQCRGIFQKVKKDVLKLGEEEVGKKDASAMSKLEESF